MPGLSDALVVPWRRLGAPAVPPGAAGGLPRGVIARGGARLSPHVLIASGDRLLAPALPRRRWANGCSSAARGWRATAVGVAGLPEAAPDDLFAGLGRAVIHPQDLPLSAQVAAVRGARLIAGVGGSPLHLSAFARAPGPRLLRLVPAPWRPDTERKILAPVGGSVTDLALDPPPGEAVPAQKQKAPLHLTEALRARIGAAAAAAAAVEAAG